jgi:CTD kinase subunit alpha
MLELYARRPVFQGNDEIHQLEVITEIMGTPTHHDWPALGGLPWYELVKPKVQRASRLLKTYAK